MVCRLAASTNGLLSNLPAIRAVARSKTVRTLRSGSGLVPGSACAPAEGEPLLQETLAGYETVPDSWRRYDTQSMFGAGLAGQGKYAEAEAQLLSGLSGPALALGHDPRG